jgi:hypothetical protein
MTKTKLPPYDAPAAVMTKWVNEQLGAADWEFLKTK